MFKSLQDLEEDLPMSQILCTMTDFQAFHMVKYEQQGLKSLPACTNSLTSSVRCSWHELAGPELNNAVQNRQ